MPAMMFYVKGSAAEPYQVEFEKNGSNLTATCTCPAGINGLYCKHRFRILAGQTKDIVSKNEADVATVAQWLKGSDVEQAMNRLAVAEKELTDIKKKVSKLKKEVAKAMRD